MVPRASNSIADDDSFTERPAIVRTLSADRKNIGAPARQEHRLASNVPGQHSSLGDGLYWNSLGEIRYGYVALVRAQLSSCLSNIGNLLDPEVKVRHVRPNMSSYPLTY